MGNPEKCPVPSQNENDKEGKAAKSPQKANEKLGPKQSPKKAPEAPLVKSERQKKLEERLKGTAWRVKNIDTAPTYRTALDIERKAYDSLSDSAAEKKGLRRIYNEKGELIRAEIAETLDHKMTIELGGEFFTKKLPIEVRQYMKSLGFSGPHITVSNIFVAEDGSLDLKKMVLRVSDRDHSKATKELEDTCRQIIQREDGMLTPKALRYMEKGAIEWYTQQTAVHLDIGMSQKETEKADKVYFSGVEKDIESIIGTWEKAAKNELLGEYNGYLDKNVLNGSTVSRIKDGNGYGIEWKNFQMFHGDPKRYSMKIYADLATGRIGKIQIFEIVTNHNGLISKYQREATFGSRMLTGEYKGKPLVDMLHSLETTFRGIKKLVWELEGEEERDEKLQKVFSEWRKIWKRGESMYALPRINVPRVKVGRLSEGEYGIESLDFIVTNEYEFSIRIEIDITTGKFKNIYITSQNTKPMGIYEGKEEVDSTMLTSIFRGKKISTESISDIVEQAKKICEKARPE